MKAAAAAPPVVGNGFDGGNGCAAATIVSTRAAAPEAGVIFVPGEAFGEVMNKHMDETRTELEKLPFSKP
jgi:hypothetical protein